MQLYGLIFRAYEVTNIVYIVSHGVSLGFSRVLVAERCGSGAADSGSEARADAVCRRLQPVVRQGPRVMCTCPRYATHAYWITSSASRSSDGGIVIPSSFAVLRLMTSSNFVGCSTGKS